MPTLALNPDYTTYHEEASCAFTYDREGVNPQGLLTHRVRPNYGAVQFAPFGFRFLGGVGFRNFPLMPEEGPHVSFGALVWSLPIAAPTVTSATLFLRCTSGSPGEFAFLIYGVASDDFWGSRVSRDFGSYPATYRQEYFQGGDGTPWGWGKYRRYRVDTDEYTQEHTAAVVPWRPTIIQDVTTPDLSPIFNEIVGRPGWKPGNRLCLVIAPDTTGLGVEPFEPLFDNGSGGGPNSFSGAWTSNDYRAPLDAPVLTITY